MADEQHLGCMASAFEYRRHAIRDPTLGTLPALKTKFRPLLIDLGMHATIAQVMASLAHTATAKSRGAVIEAANRVDVIKRLASRNQRLKRPDAGTDSSV